MPTVSDIKNTVLSGLNHIDALLDVGPDWNYLTPVGNTIQYTFSVVSGNETGTSGQSTFSAAQQGYARSALAYISQLTGVQFVETSNGTAAQIHLANMDISGANTTGLCSWSYSIRYSGDELISYDNDTYVYLDNAEWAGRNSNLAPGGYGYETLLHELGHAMGLKHPFDGDIHLPAGADNTANTLMSYTGADGPHATFSQYDIAALNWIYGGDGLRGNLGMNSTTGARYVTGTSGSDTLTGTAFNDTLEGDGGNDYINGGAGVDTAVFRAARSAYTFSKLANGDIYAVGSANGDGADILSSIEIFKFSDGTYQSADLVGSAALAPLTGSAGNDRISATGGHNAIDGLGGIDTVLYSGARANFTVAASGNGFTVTDKAGGTGSDTLANVERIQFSDASLALDVNGTGGQAYRLYQAAFNRTPDAAGLGYWIKAMDGGATLNSAAAAFVASPEFTGLYGANPGDDVFVATLYNNVLHRAGEPAGQAYWVDVLHTNPAARNVVLANFSEGLENQAQVIGSIQNGFAFTPYG